MPRHIEDNDLDRYSMGILAEELVPEVEEHLLECSACQARLENSDQFATLFRIAAVAPDARPARSWWKRLSRPVLAWPAVAAVAASLLFIVEQRREPMGAPATVILQSLRGPESAAQVAAGKPARLVFELNSMGGQEPVEARIVDSLGSQILSAPVSTDQGRATVVVNKLRKGSYWVRLYGKGQDDLIAEYGLTSK